MSATAEVALLLSAGTFWAPEKEGTHRPPSTRGIIGALDGFFHAKEMTSSTMMAGIRPYDPI